ncbi:MAG: host-nuclease inhibitor Gam family protein [Ignavibacteriaceae bacterium]
MAKLKKVTTLKTLDDVNNRLAELKIANAKLDRTTADLNVKRTELENKYTPELSSLREQKLLLEADIELWAEAHKPELESRRSWEVLHGSIGYRSSTKLSTLRKFKWADVLEKIKGLKGKFNTYIRIKEEVAKDELKADIQSEGISKDEAQKIGVYIEEVDNFFIETNSLEVKEK